MSVKPNEDDDIFLSPDDDPPNRHARTSRARKVVPLRPLPGAFVRVPIQWLSKPGRKHIAPTKTRLFLYVLYRSLWGQRGVEVTDQVAAKVGVEPRQKRRIILQLQREGWVRIERDTPLSSPFVWPIVLAA
jgi:hypothetical protein